MDELFCGNKIFFKQFLISSICCKINNFQQLTKPPANLWKDKGPHVIMRKFFNLPESLTYVQKLLFLNDSLRITFVRHPFVRLVSTYQDKVVDHDYSKWREKIFAKFKTSNSEVKSELKKPAQPENFNTKLSACIRV